MLATVQSKHVKDTTRLRRCLLAGLLLGPVGCDRESVEAEPPEATRTETPPAQPSAKLDVGSPEVPDTPRLDVGTEKLDVGGPPEPQTDPAPIGRKPFRTLPSCPTVNACWDKGEARKMSNGGKRTLGCPTRIKAKKMHNKRGAHLGKGDKAKFSKEHTTRERERARGDADACCYEWVERCPGGRPILDDAGDLVRPVATVTSASNDPRRHAAEAWLEDARTEAASVASFERVVQELQAVGAPASLCEEARRAAADEQRHARACLDVARSLGLAAELGPNPSPAQRDATLVRLVRDTFAEGAVGETIAALCASRAAAACPDPQIQTVLERIAEDESRHAALAWKTLGWAVAVGGPEVLAALQDEASRAARTLRTSASEPGTTEDAERWGRLGAAARRRARTDAWNDVIEPLLQELAA